MGRQATIMKDTQGAEVSNSFETKPAGLRTGMHLPTTFQESHMAAAKKKLPKGFVPFGKKDDKKKAKKK